MQINLKPGIGERESWRESPYGEKAAQSTSQGPTANRK
jgi:hypothetical protein